MAHIDEKTRESHDFGADIEKALAVPKEPTPHHGIGRETSVAQIFGFAVGLLVGYVAGAIFGFG